MKGYIVVLYFDDAILACFSLEQAVKMSKDVFNDLLQAHILPNKDKSIWTPQQSVDWLGYTWQFHTKSVKVSQRRADELIARLSVLEDSFPVVTARQVARFVGSLVSMMLVIQNRSLLYSRYLHVILNFRAWENLGWDKKINVNQIKNGSKILFELKLIREQFDNWNNMSFSGVLWENDCIVFGDAGEKAVGGFCNDNRFKIPYHIPLPASLLDSSSALRECFALLTGIQLFRSRISGKRVLYVTDR